MLFYLFPDIQPRNTRNFHFPFNKPTVGETDRTRCVSIAKKYYFRNIALTDAALCRQEIAFG